MCERKCFLNWFSVSRSLSYYILLTRTCIFSRIKWKSKKKSIKQSSNQNKQAKKPHSPAIWAFSCGGTLGSKKEKHTHTHTHTHTHKVTHASRLLDDYRCDYLCSLFIFKTPRHLHLHLCCNLSCIHAHTYTQTHTHVSPISSFSLSHARAKAAHNTLHPRVRTQTHTTAAQRCWCILCERFFKSKKKKVVSLIHASHNKMLLTAFNT
jgi:hypothetical protein